MPDPDSELLEELAKMDPNDSQYARKIFASWQRYVSGYTPKGGDFDLRIAEEKPEKTAIQKLKQSKAKLDSIKRSISR